MPKLCGNCYFIGKGKCEPEGSIDGAGFCIGFGLLGFSLSNKLNYVYAIVAPVVTVAIIIVGILMLWNTRRKGNICPVCEQKPMISLESDKAKSIIANNENLLDQLNSSNYDNQSICSDCHYLSMINSKKNSSLIWGILLVIFSILTAPYAWNSYKSGSFGNIALAGTITWGLFGAYIIISHILKPVVCPNCKKTNTLLPLDTPRAQELIKEQNLTIPSNSPDQTNT